MPEINVPITPPRVPIIDPRTQQVSREWYMFFLSLHQTTENHTFDLDDIQATPSVENYQAQIVALQNRITQLETQIIPQIFSKLQELTDVYAPSPLNDDKLIYNTVDQRWKSESRSYLMLE